MPKTVIEKVMAAYGLLVVFDGNYQMPPRVPVPARRCALRRSPARARSAVQFVSGSGERTPRADGAGHRAEAHRDVAHHGDRDSDSGAHLGDRCAGNDDGSGADAGDSQVPPGSDQKGRVHAGPGIEDRRGARHVRRSFAVAGADRGRRRVSGSDQEFVARLWAAVAELVGHRQFQPFPGKHAGVGQQPDVVSDLRRRRDIFRSRDRRVDGAGDVHRNRIRTSSSNRRS